MSKFKEYIMIMLAVIILGFSSYSAWVGDGEYHSHEEFFTEVREFMSKGGRNTSDMGKKLCERLNRLEKEAGEEPTDCDKAYSDKIVIDGRYHNDKTHSPRCRGKCKHKH